MNVLIKKLKSNNCKTTPQRIAVYKAVTESTDHPNAETIFKQLSPLYPTMSLATVYKSLELFVQLGLIQIINVGENSFRYDGRTEEHSHIICTQCWKIEDLDNNIFEDLTSKVQQVSSYNVERKQLCFYGTCSDCSKAMCS